MLENSHRSGFTSPYLAVGWLQQASPRPYCVKAVIQCQIQRLLVAATRVKGIGRVPEGESLVVKCGP